jgi:hypothetical protein
MRYFAPSGWFAFARGTFLHQDLNRGASVQGGVAAQGDETSDSGTSFLVDVGIGLRLGQGRTIAALTVANLLDAPLKYRDDNFRSDRELVSRYAPERTILGRISFRF